MHYLRYSALVCMAMLIPQEFVAAQDREKADYAVRRAFRELVEPVKTSVVEVENDQKKKLVLGTIVSSDGYVVTKASVLGDSEIFCRMSDDSRVPATLIASDEDVDLALLKIGKDNLKPIALSNDSKPTSGSFVVSVSRRRQPLGIGIVSVDERRFRKRRSYNPNRSYLGVECDPVEGGLSVSRVVPDSAADRSGLLRRDTILSIDNNPVGSVSQLRRELGKFKPKDKVDIQIRRAEKPLTITAKLGVFPVDQPEDHWGGGPFSKRRFGFPSVITHDTTLIPQQCGGPLVDTDGNVVGINIARALRVATYAIPINQVAEFVKRSKTNTSNP